MPLTFASIRAASASAPTIATSLCLPWAFRRSLAKSSMRARPKRPVCAPPILANAPAVVPWAFASARLIVMVAEPTRILKDRPDLLIRTPVRPERRRSSRRDGRIASPGATCVRAKGEHAHLVDVQGVTHGPNADRMGGRQAEKQEKTERG